MDGEKGCNHIVGFREGSASELLREGAVSVPEDFTFFYCPICGAKLVEDMPKCGAEGCIMELGHEGDCFGGCVLEP